MLRLTTPVAILIGAGFIGICVLIATFGRPRPIVPTARGESSSASVLDLPPPPTGEVTAPTGLVPSSPATEAATEDLRAQHPQLVAACWQPLFAKAPAVSSIAYSLKLSFNAAGKQATKAFLSPVGVMRQDITECVANHLAPLTIPPQEAGTSIEIPLRLP